MAREYTGPEYVNGQLTLKGMKQVLAEGGSVSYRGHLITSTEGLPPESALVASDPAAIARVRIGLTAQQDAIRLQLEQLDLKQDGLTFPAPLPLSAPRLADQPNLEVVAAPDGPTTAPKLVTPPSGEPPTAPGNGVKK